MDAPCCSFSILFLSHLKIHLYGVRIILQLCEWQKIIFCFIPFTNDDKLLKIIQIKEYLGFLLQSFFHVNRRKKKTGILGTGTKEIVPRTTKCDQWHTYRVLPQTFLHPKTEVWGKWVFPTDNPYAKNLKNILEISYEQENMNCINWNPQNIGLNLLL